MDSRLTDADIGEILDTYLQQQSYNGNRPRPPSPFDPSEALFGADAFAALPGFWPNDAAGPVGVPQGEQQEHPALCHRQAAPPAQPQQTQPAAAAAVPTPLQANTFTDVLASVAAQWSPPPDDNLSSSWGTQHNLRGGPLNIKTEESGSAHGGQAFYQTARMHPADGPPSTSGSPQDLPLSGAANMEVTFDGPGAGSRSEGSEKGGAQRRGSAKARETQADRLQHRKSRKREKDKIEELQAAVNSVVKETAQLAAQNTKAEGELQAHVEELRRLRAAEESALTALADEELAARFNGDVTLTVLDGRATVLSPEQIKAMTEDDMAYWWNLYIGKLTGLLAAADARAGGPPPDTARRIQALQREALFLHIRAAITNMHGVKRFLARGKVEGPYSDTGNDMVEHWKLVAEGLQLSGEQRGAVASLWRSFDGRLERILGARRAMHASITATMPNGILGRDFAVNFLKAHEGMDALKFNLRQEHVVICDFVSTFHQTLTPVQNARFIVSSFPFFPDTVACSLWIAALDQDQEALRRLHKEWAPS